MSAPMTRPTHCICCHRKFRPARSQAAMFPGTVMHTGRGLCGNCYRRNRLDSPATAPAVQSEQLARHREQEAQRMGELIIQRAKFEADRARRGVPAAGQRTIRNVLTHRSVSFLQEAA